MRMVLGVGWITLSLPSRTSCLTRYSDMSRSFMAVSTLTQPASPRDATRSAMRRARSSRAARTSVLKISSRSLALIVDWLLTPDSRLLTCGRLGEAKGAAQIAARASDEGAHLRLEVLE